MSFIHKFKYIIIDTETEEVVLKNSFREIAEFINLVSVDQVSHNTVGKRLAENKHFTFNDLIIKALIW
jgi:hypothetical protein